MTNGRRKGQLFMFETCRTLSHWWFDTPLDAHHATLPMRPKSTIAAPLEGWVRKADLVVDPRFADEWPFAVECKNDEGWKELERLFEVPKYPLWKWWEQCVAQAATWENAHPLLIFSRNRRRTYAVARYETLEWLQPKPQRGPVVTVDRPGGERLGMLLLDDLVAAGRPRPRRSPRRRSPGRSRKSSS